MSSRLTYASNSRTICWGASRRSYARKILTSFKGVLSEARTQGWLKGDPAENVRIVLSERAMPKHETWLTLADVRNILRKADQKAASTNKQISKRWQRYRAFVYVAVFSGMRPGEVLGLPWRNVLFDQDAIKVEQDMDEDGTIGRPKSKNAYRTIRMGKQVMNILRAWKKECPASKHDLVFPNWQGNPEKLQNVYRRCWYTLQEAVGLVDEQGKAKYPLKDLRHVRASMEIDNGANPKEITMLMGHSSVKITYDVYGHLFEDHSERRAQRAGQLELSFFRFDHVPNLCPVKNKTLDFSGLQGCPVGLKILVSVVQIRPRAPFKIKDLALNSPILHQNIRRFVPRCNPRKPKATQMGTFGHVPNLCPAVPGLAPGNSRKSAIVFFDLSRSVFRPAS